MNYWEQFIQKVWSDRLDKRLPVMVTVLFIVLMGNALANMTWKLVPVPELQSSLSSANSSNPVTQSRRVEQPMAVQIASWNLFGKFEKKKVEALPIPAVEDAPETTLNLKLKGVFATRDPYDGRAIIADSKGKDTFYTTGAAVIGGAVLAQVFEDKVLLERNGQFETLKLPIDVPPSADPEIRSPVSRRPHNQSTRRDVTSRNPETQRVLRKYRNDLINNPQTVMSKFPLRVQPYNKGGKLVGYRVRPGKDRKLLSMLGLRNGDVVTSVNGVPLDNPIKALEIIKSLPTTTQFTVDFERNGVPQSSSFTLPQ